jgi:hypothetical protein
LIGPTLGVLRVLGPEAAVVDEALDGRRAAAGGLEGLDGHRKDLRVVEPPEVGLVVGFVDHLDVPGLVAVAAEGGFLRGGVEVEEAVEGPVVVEDVAAHVAASGEGGFDDEIDGRGAGVTFAGVVGEADDLAGRGGRM